MNEDQTRPADSIGDDSPLMRMQTGLFEHARRRALDSGATDPDKGDLDALTAHAASMARDVYQDKYDPAAHASDAGRENEYQRLLKERAEADAAERIAEADVKDKESALAGLPPCGERPAADPLLVGAAFAALLLSIAPTVHDLIAGSIDDAILAWLFAALAGSGTAAFLTLAIIRNGDPGARDGRRGRPGVVAGVVVGIGLLLVRLAICQTPLEALVPVGLTLLEIGVVLFLDRYAAALAPRQTEWRARRDAVERAERDRDAARLLFGERRDRIGSLSSGINDHVKYVERRRLANAKVADIEAAAVKAVHDGYQAGLAENRGRVRGLRRKGGGQ